MRSGLVHQVKIFISLESNVEGLEKKINAWLKESGAKVINMFGNIAPQTVTTASKGTMLAERKFSSSDVFITVLYEAA